MIVPQATCATADLWGKFETRCLRFWRVSSIAFSREPRARPLLQSSCDPLRSWGARPCDPQASPGVLLQVSRLSCNPLGILGPGLLRSSCDPWAPLRCSCDAPAILLRCSCDAPAILLRSSCDPPAILLRPLAPSCDPWAPQASLKRRSWGAKEALRRPF